MVHTCVVGGWTEARGTRPFFGSLLLGMLDEQGELRYAGRISGFTDAEVGRVWKQLHMMKVKESALAVPPDIAVRVHWVKPKLSVQVKFSGWTKDGRLRRPVYAGLEADARRERASQDRHSVAADR